MELSEIPSIVRWHFAWIDEENTPFDPSTMGRNDEFVKACEITHEHTGHAVATVTVRNRNRIYADRTWAWISCTVGLDGVFQRLPWFKGYLESWPTSGDGREITLQLIGKPSDWTERQEAALEALRSDPFFYDSAFIGSRDPVTQPEVTLEARPAVVNCDPVTHEATVVSVIDAPKRLDIGRLWNGRSLSFTKGDSPLDVVRVKVDCRYRQPVAAPFVIDYSGYTLTPQSVYNGIPKVGSQLETGYTVRDVSIDFSIHADGSDAVQFAAGDVRTGGMAHIGSVGLDDGDEAALTSVISRWSFGGSITTQVSYEIERQESYEIDVRWNGQKTNRVLGPARSEDIPLEISMQDASGFRRWRPKRQVSKGDLYSYGGLAYVALRDGTTGDTFASDQDAIDQGGAADPLWERFDSPNDRRYASTFFGTPRGVEALKHAILVGQARLAVNRTVEQGFATTLQLLKPAMGLQVSCDMMMSVSGLPLVDGDLVGKVTSWTLYVDRSGARFSVTLGSCPGSGIDPFPDDDYDTSPRVELTRLPSSANFDILRAYDMEGGWGPRPAPWPQERAWPPTLDEDTLGIYTSQRALQRAYPDVYDTLDAGRRYLVNIEVGTEPDPDWQPDPEYPDETDPGLPIFRDVYVAYVGYMPFQSEPLPPLSANPYLVAPSAWGPKPAAWPQWDGVNGMTGDIVAWPPTEADDVCQYHLVPPKFDEMDGTGGDRSLAFVSGARSARSADDTDAKGYAALPASAEPWDKVMFKQTRIPTIPGIPADFLAPPRQGRDDEGNIITIPGGVEVKWPANEQEATLGNRDAPHWAQVALGNPDPFDGKPNERDPKPGDPNFDPEKALDKMETEVTIHLVDVTGASSDVQFAADAYWNGPKHVDLERPQ